MPVDVFFLLPNRQLGVPESKQAVLGCVRELCLLVQSPPVISAPTPLCHRLMPDLSQAEASSCLSYRSEGGKRFGVRIKNMHREKPRDLSVNGLKLLSSVNLFLLLYTLPKCTCGFLPQSKDHLLRPSTSGRSIWDET